MLTVLGRFAVAYIVERILWGTYADLQVFLNRCAKEGKHAVVEGLRVRMPYGLRIPGNATIRDCHFIMEYKSRDILRGDKAGSVIAVARQQTWEDLKALGYTEDEFIDAWGRIIGGYIREPLETSEDNGPG